MIYLNSVRSATVFRENSRKVILAFFRKWCKVSSVEWATHVSGLKVCAAAGLSSSPSLQPFTACHPLLSPPLGLSSPVSKKGKCTPLAVLDKNENVMLLRASCALFHLRKTWRVSFILQESFLDVWIRVQLKKIKSGVLCEA